MKTSIIVTLAVSIFLVGFNSSASAELYAYEGFDEGTETGNGTSGEWTYLGGTAFSEGFAYSPDTLSILGVPSLGGSVKSVFFNNSLHFEESVPIAGGAKFVSFMFEAEGRAGDYESSFESQAGVIDQDGRPIVAGIGFSQGESEKFNLSSHIKTEGYSGAYDLAAVMGDMTVFTIMKFSDVGGNKALVEVWFLGANTELPETLDKEKLPGSCVYGAYYVDDVIALKGFNISSFGMTTTFDEFRIGNSYQSVIGK